MIECDVIRDLMPLYAEGLASEATRRVVETHTVCCPGCRRQLEAMCTPLEPDLTEENKNYIRAIREQNEKNIRQTLKGCAVVLLACLLVFNMPFTLLKGLLDVLLAFLIYKPLSPLLHK